MRQWVARVIFPFHVNFVFPSLIVSSFEFWILIHSFSFLSLLFFRSLILSLYSVPSPSDSLFSPYFLPLLTMNVHKKHQNGTRSNSRSRSHMISSHENPSLSSDDTKGEWIQWNEREWVHNFLSFVSFSFSYSPLWKPLVIFTFCCHPSSPFVPIVISSSPVPRVCFFLLLWSIPPQDNIR